MIVNLDHKQFKHGLSKLCKIASLNSLDSFASQIKLTAKGDCLYGETINDARTQALVVKFDNVSCSIQEEGACCVPAKPLQQTVDLMKGDTIEISTDGTLVNFKSLPHNKKDETQSIEGLDVKQWISVSKTESNNVVSLDRDFFLDLGKFSASSCSVDKSKAPLTGIYINISEDGSILCTSTDYVKIAFYDSKQGAKDNDLNENISIMFPVDVSKKIAQVFEKDIAEFTAKIDDKKIVLQGGNVAFAFSTEVGVENYPPLRSYFPEQLSISTDIELTEVLRIAGLLAAAAPKAACDITFDKDQITFEAQQGRNKSRHTLDASIEAYVDLPQTITIAVYDLVSALAIPTQETINMGLVPINNNAKQLFQIQQKDDNISWKQVILSARQIIPEEEDD